MSALQQQHHEHMLGNAHTDQGAGTRNVLAHAIAWLYTSLADFRVCILIRVNLRGIQCSDDMDTTYIRWHFLQHPQSRPRSSKGD